MGLNFDQAPTLLSSLWQQTDSREMASRMLNVVFVILHDDWNILDGQITVHTAMPVSPKMCRLFIERQIARGSHSEFLTRSSQWYKHQQPLGIIIKIYQEIDIVIGKL